MEHLHTDVLVVGWGKGGKTLAGQLGRAGREVTLVEQSADMVGGTCINVACVPTKVLVASASRRRDEDDIDDWFATAVDGRDALITRLRAANRAMLEAVDAVRLVGGRATFVGPRRVSVRAGTEELEISADVVLINTGTVPAIPPIPGVDGAHVYDSTTIQHASPLPRRLVIIGAGPIGLEFAGMFSNFGSEVTVVNSSLRLLPGEDRDVADVVESILVDSGVRFAHAARATRIEASGSSDVSVTLAATDGVSNTVTPKSLAGDAVLLAAGRAPTTGGLGLEAAGIALDEHGYIRVDEFLRTSAENVWAIGDIHGGPQQTYLSLDDSRIIGAQLSGTERRSTADRVAVPTTVFTTPPYAAVGMTETAARAAGCDILVAKKAVAKIAAAPRPKIVGDARGIVKFIVDAESDLILGARLVVVDAQELINLIALAMRAGVTATELREGIWTHPSTTELLNEVLAQLT